MAASKSSCKLRNDFVEEGGYLIEKGVEIYFLPLPGCYQNTDTLIVGNWLLLLRSSVCYRNAEIQKALGF